MFIKNANQEINSPHYTVSYSLQGARHAVTQSMTNWLRSAHFSIVSFSKLTRMPNEDVLHLKKNLYEIRHSVKKNKT